VAEDLHGRIVVITGAGSGIGEALAGRFRSDGAHVAGCDLPHAIESVSTACDLAVAADVTNAEEMNAFAAQVIERFGRVDALIANAGVARAATIQDGAWDDIESVVRVNLFGVLHSIRAFLPIMREQGQGRIVALASRTLRSARRGSWATALRRPLWSLQHAPWRVSWKAAIFSSTT